MKHAIDCNIILITNIIKSKILYMNIYERIGIIIKEKRIEQNIQEIEMAKQINMSLNRLQRIETGESKISIKLLDKISEVLNIESYEIVRLAGSL